MPGKIRPDADKLAECLSALRDCCMIVDGRISYMEWFNTELDNALVRQKDSIIQMIGRDKLKARQMLELVRPIWGLLDYDYKYHELREKAK